MPGSMKWRLALLFGMISVLSVVATGVGVYIQSAHDFGTEMEIALHALAGTVSQTIDPERIDRLRSLRDPYYEELRRHLHRFTVDYNLSWLGVYRFSGGKCLHIADGEDLGNGFCLDYPILSVSEELKRAWGGTPTDSGTYEDAYGFWQGCFYPVTKRDGTVVGVIDASRDLNTLQRFRMTVIRRTVTIGAMLVILTLVLSFLFARSVSLPVTRLSDAAGKIAAGDLSMRIPELGGGNEIKTLVGSFNEMVGELDKSHRQLQQKVFELGTLYEVSQKVTFSNTTEEILRNILVKSVEALQASWGNVLLINEEEGVLVETMSSIVFSGSGAKPIRISPEDGLAGRAFQQKNPVSGLRSAGGPLHPFGPEFPLDIRSALFVPLLIEGKSTGVLCLFDRMEGDFSPAEVWLASTLASQMALSLEKSRLYELAVTDGLTKLFVHRYFQLALDNEIKRARRYDASFSLILLDIDHFKSFNDTYGHQLGDQVLAITARILKQSLRGADIPARYGGEEFATILPETGPQEALRVAERIRTSVEAVEVPYREKALRVTVSLGVASFPAHSKEKLDLVKKADMAMYESKRSGRNRATLFNEKIQEKS